MEKRQWGELNEPLGESKRHHITSLEDAGTQPLEAEFFVEQRLVGWMIGRAGSTMKEIESTYQVKVALDQSSKDLGYSKVRFGGPANAVQAAADHVNGSLARAAAGTNTDGSAPVGPFLLDAPPGSDADPMYEEMQIEQQFIGWLLGKQGAVVREIENASGCKISINQDSRNQGYSKAQLFGRADERALASQLVQNSLDRARQHGGMSSLAGGFSSEGMGGGCVGGIGGGLNGSGPARIIEEGLQIEQRWVGWLLGKGGGVAKEIEQETGARVSIDQSTKDLGYSTVKISGEVSCVEIAKGRVSSSLQKVGGVPLQGTTASGGSTGSTQIQIEQQHVGWLVGRGGQVVREIEMNTGCKISLNQESKDLGYSVATVTGDSQQVSSGYEQITEKIRQVDPVAAGPAILGSMGGQDVPALQRPPGITLASQSQRGYSSQPQHISPPSITLPSHRPQQPPPFMAPSGGSGAILGSSLELNVEQKWVGWLLGKGGKTMRDIEAETGATITMDQSSRDLGYSTVKVIGSSLGVQLAQQRIQASLDMASSHPGGGGDAMQGASIGGCGGASQPEGFGGDAVGDLIQVEQRYVGWLLGKSGIVLKEIEQQSGAQVKIDQSTKDQGFSTVRIGGNAYTVQEGRRLINDKIAQAQAMG